MSERTFAFIIHPLDPVRDVARKYPALGRLPRWLIEFISVFYPPVLISEISGVRSADTGETARGWFIACPLSARLMVSLPPAVVYRKIIQSGRLAQRKGAKILGLGAFTSVVGDGGITVGQALDIAVTTGNSYTVATAIQGLQLATEQLGITMEQSRLAVLGATGAIGNICAHLLADQVQSVLLVGRREEELQRVARSVGARGAARVETAVDVAAIADADLVISATSTVAALIEPQHLKQGAVVCDVARPRDVARQVARRRKDVFVFEGGVIRPPGSVDFGFNFGFPPRTAYACMAETMALALEGRFESFTLGKRLTEQKVREIDAIAARHGFRLAGLRSFDRAISDGEVEAFARFRSDQAVRSRATTPVLV